MDVRFYATLRPIAGGKLVSFDIGDGATARDVLEAACERFPALAPLIWTAEGELGEYIKMFVDGREIRHLKMLETPVPAGAEVDIFPPAAGG
jgi:sulfur-carrier protein